MDLCTGGDLKQNLVISKHGRFSEAKAKFYACEILLGLEDLHAKNIIYRDLKLENVLLDVKGHCYLSDFGLAVQKKHSDGYSGTPGYIAPEIILKQKYDR